MSFPSSSSVSYSSISGSSFEHSQPSFTPGIPRDTLSNACKTRDLDFVRLAIQKGAIPDSQTLTWACLSANVAIIDTVIARGATPDNETLNAACATNQVIIVKKVIALGAPMSAKTLNLARGTHNPAIIEMIESLHSPSFAPQMNMNKAMESMSISKSQSNQLIPAHRPPRPIKRKAIDKENCPKGGALYVIPRPFETEGSKCVNLHITEACDLTLEILGKHCPNLRYLKVSMGYNSHYPITDKGFEYLTRLHNLQSLDVSHTAITDKGLEYVRSYAIE